MYQVGNARNTQQNPMMQQTSMVLPLDSGVVADMPYFESKEYQGPFGLGRGGTACLYVVFLLLFFIGAGGVAVSLSFYLLNYPTSDNSTWKIVGIAVGGFMLIASVVLLIIFGCDHCSHAGGCMPGSKRNNRVSNSYVGRQAKTGRQGPDVNITGLYRINDAPDRELQNEDPDKFINQQARKQVKSHKRATRFGRRRRSNRISSVPLSEFSDDAYSYDETDDEEFPNARFYNHHAPSRYPSHYGMFPPNYYHPQALPPPDQQHQQPQQPLERPVTTIIKEIHHHHYGPAPDETTTNERKQSSKPASSRSKRNSAVSARQAQIQVADNTPAVAAPTGEVQTYQLNAAGQLQLVSSKPASAQQPQIVTQNQVPGTKWIVVRNTVPKLINTTQAFTQRPIILQAPLQQQQQPVYIQQQRNNTYQPLTEEEEDEEE